MSGEMPVHVVVHDGGQVNISYGPGNTVRVQSPLTLERIRKRGDALRPPPGTGVGDGLLDGPTMDMSELPPGFDAVVESVAAGVNGQVEVPAGGQVKVPTPRG